MMKKNGFTLAEVLITLAIIGVVATLTLPALMTNVGEQQYKTALKKALNTLSEAGQMSQAMDGFDYSSFTTDATNDEDASGNVNQSIYSLLHRRTNMAQVGEGKDHKNAGDTYKGNSVVYFRDGTSLIFEVNKTLSNGNSDFEIDAIIDVNGKKGPNQMSNCAGLNGTAAKAGLKDATDQTTCTTNKQKRLIKDQFPIRLKNGLAMPNSAAANWAATD